MPASRSPIGTPTRCGSCGPAPVSDISPPSPCAIWSYPGRPPSGPSCPKPLMLSTTSRGLRSCSTASGKPSRSSTPGRKFSSRTSARATSAPSTSRPSSDFRSSAMDSLFRLQDRKYVDSWPAPGAPAGSGLTNGGPQPRVSSPDPGVSTLITRAPRSPSIMPGVRPGERPGQVDDDEPGQRPAGRVGRCRGGRRGRGGRRCGAGSSGGRGGGLHHGRHLRGADPDPRGPIRAAARPGRTRITECSGNGPNVSKSSCRSPNPARDPGPRGPGSGEPA